MVVHLPCLVSTTNSKLKPKQWWWYVSDYRRQGMPGIRMQFQSIQYQISKSLIVTATSCHVSLDQIYSSRLFLSIEQILSYQSWNVNCNQTSLWPHFPQGDWLRIKKVVWTIHLDMHPCKQSQALDFNVNLLVWYDREFCSFLRSIQSACSANWLIPSMK